MTLRRQANDRRPLQCPLRNRLNSDSATSHHNQNESSSVAAVTITMAVMVAITIDLAATVASLVKIHACGSPLDGYVHRAF